MQFDILKTKTKSSTIPPKKNVKRIGIAEGAFKVPEDFDKWDEEISALFEAEDIY